MVGIMIGVIIGASAILLTKLVFPNARGDNELLAILGFAFAICSMLVVFVLLSDDPSAFIHALM